MRVVADVGKKLEVGLDSMCKFDPHFLLDVEVFATPDHGYRCPEFREIRLEVILVARELLLIVVDGVHRGHIAVTPTDRDILPEFA